MLKKLQKRWKVTAFQLVLVLCVFTIGGSLSGWVGKRIMDLLQLQNRVLWVIVYIVVLTIIWPIMVFLVSIFFGQTRFFKSYIRKMGLRMGIIKKTENP